MKPVPKHIKRPSYITGEPPGHIYGPSLKKRMVETCQMAAQLLQEAGKMVSPGVSTEEIDDFVHEQAIEMNAYPSPLGYPHSNLSGPPFPKSVCTSVNEVICHGVPGQQKLEEGDIVNIDVTIFFNGVHGDTSRTFPVGNISKEAQRLISFSESALIAGIQAVEVGSSVGNVGRAIQAHIPDDLAVCPYFCGHGVNSVFHDEPMVFHTQVPDAFTPNFQEARPITIEPIVLPTSPGNIPIVRSDGWTVVTKDGSWSAQAEDTLWPSKKGIEILTL